MPRGAKPGEYRGGRQQGTPNKATAEAKLAISELAKTYAPAALKRLAELADKAQSEAAQVAAIKEILDRAYGRAPQAVSLTGEGGGPLQVEITDPTRGVEPRAQVAKAAAVAAAVAPTAINPLVEIVDPTREVF